MRACLPRLWPLVASLALSGALAQAQPPPPPDDAPPPPHHDDDAPPPPPRPGRPGGPLHEPLIRALEEHRPELARRMRELRIRAPELLHEALVSVLAAHLGPALDAAERGAPPADRAAGGPPQHPAAPPPPPGTPPPPPDGPGPRGPRDGTPRGPLGPGRPGRPPLGEAGPRPPLPAPSPDELEEMRDERERMRALHDEERELMQLTQAAAQALRRLPAGAAADVRSAAREKLETLVRRQFAVRTRIRSTELERIERDWRRLEREIGRLREAAAERDREAEAIIQRRLRDLGASPAAASAPAP